MFQMCIRIPSTYVVIPTTEPQNDICLLESDTGPCKAKMRRYFFNSETGQCEMFAYGGCRGNANNFGTLVECQRTCMGKCRCVVLFTCFRAKYILVSQLPQPLLLLPQDQQKIPVLPHVHCHHQNQSPVKALVGDS